jgi:hypothetical protein
MKLFKILIFSLLSIIALSFFITSCQKLDRPVLGKIIEDPTPPPYNALKSYWQFENNATDEGENKLTGTAKNLTYVPGISGQAVQVGADGYLLLTAVGDTVEYPNEYIALPADTLRNLGSYTISFWMNGAGPVGPAQGLFAISNKTAFWGNLEMFFETWNNAADPSEAFLKIHMLNDSKAPADGEQWNELKIPGLLNKWSHLVVTYNASNSQISVYANGQPTTIVNKVLDEGKYGKLKFKDFNGMVLGNFAFQTTPTLTNHGPEDWARPFSGAYDQFRIYNRALSVAEITELFNTKK